MYHWCQTQVTLCRLLFPERLLCDSIHSNCAKLPLHVTEFVNPKDSDHHRAQTHQFWDWSLRYKLHKRPKTDSIPTAWLIFEPGSRLRYPKKSVTLFEMKSCLVICASLSWCIRLKIGEFVLLDSPNLLSQQMRWFLGEAVRNWSELNHKVTTRERVTGIA